MNETNPQATMDQIFHRLCLSNDAGKIVIKLNPCEFMKPETGAVSDPVMVEILPMSLRSRYPHANILLVEKDATVVLADEMFRFLGFDTLANKYQASVLNLARDGWHVRTIDGMLFKRIEVPRSLNEADILITHSKLKTHMLTKMTCGLKNMLGCFRLSNFTREETIAWPVTPKV